MLVISSPGLSVVGNTLESRLNDDGIPAMTFSEVWTALPVPAHSKGMTFEALVGWWLRNDPAFSIKVADVWRWSEWPGRWGVDRGIDHVVRTHSGELWAVQAKAYDPDRPLPKTEIDKFLSESNRTLFDRRLLVTTTRALGRGAQQVIDGQAIPVDVVQWADLDESAVVWPDPVTLAGGGRRQPHSLRPHQEKAVADAVAGLAESERGQLVMACGTGKTLTCLRVAERSSSELTLVLVPSLLLLKQTLNDWLTDTTTGFDDWLAVCSDESVGNDVPVAHTTELGLPVTTDPARIAEFLGRSGRRVVFSTYQSAAEVATAQQQTKAVFDLVVCDEAHRLAGKVNADFGCVLDADRIRARRRLFATATPRVFTQAARDKADGRGVEIASMDDPSVFGPVLHRYAFSEAIREGTLSDYRVVVVGIDDEMIAALIDRRELLQAGHIETDAASLAAHIGVAKATDDYDLQRLISFHSRVTRARRFVDEHPRVLEWATPSTNAKPFRADYVAGTMSTGERARRLELLTHLDSGQRGLVANARCLAEGVDVPTLDGVAFVDPRASQVDIVQAVGRAIRYAPDKTHGTVVLSVFIPPTVDPEDALESSAFKQVWAVLNALRAHDDDLASELDELRTQLGRTGARGPLPDRIVFDLPRTVSAEFAERIGTRLVETTTESWDAWFGKLLNYVDRTGDARVPAAHVTDSGYKLGQWVNNQRATRNRQRLDAGRAQRLEVLPGWVWSSQAAQWEEGFTALSQYAIETGDARVPQAYVTEGGYRLGSWVGNQRTARNSQRLDEERAKRLEALPGWVWDTNDAQWEEGLAALSQYAAKTGDACVPAAYVTDDGHKLSQWVSNQRAAYSGQRLDAGQAQRLEVLPGWVWGTRDAQWEDGFAALSQYAAKTGDARVPTAHVTDDGYKLGKWVSKQRVAYSGQRLDEGRARRLEALLGWAWDGQIAQWEEGFTVLSQYAIETGDARVPQAYVTEGGYRLGQWVAVQRSQQQLSPDRAQRLEALPGWAWDARAAKWEEGFAILAEYVEVRGDANLGQDVQLDNGYRIGGWVAEQRTALKDGRLPDARRRRLEALPGWQWHTLDARWERQYEALRVYADETGNASPRTNFIDGDGNHLGRFVNKQRDAYRRKAMPPERIALLEALPGWLWDARPTDSWDNGFAALLQYAIETGDARVPKAHVTEDGYPLGSWVNTQRTARNDQRLSGEQTQRLEALSGWVWNVNDARWEDGFAAVQAYANATGSARPPSATFKTDDGYKLGQWITAQRSQYNDQRLSPERVDRLQSLPGWVWDGQAALWEDGFDRLIAYAEREGNAAPGDGYRTPDGYALGHWVGNRRAEHRRGELEPERVARLSAIRGWRW